MKLHLSVSLTLFLASFVAVAQADWVTVGNPGSGADPETGFGSVGYAYRISEYEVTNAEWIALLNAVAAVGDPNGLYNVNMAATYGGIQRTGSGTSGTPWVYSEKGGDTNWLNRPVNYVSWYNSLRYANWLHNGQPSGGQIAGTTEDGAYDMSLGSGLTRKPGALFFLPTEDEWYKAAYYDPAGVYYDYPTGTDTVPSNDLINPDPGNNANFLDGGYTLGSPYYTTLVGEFENSESPYGTFDQGGNLWEWNETLVSGSFRGARGNGWDNVSYLLHASYRNWGDPTYEGLNVGFRLASPIPEPSTLAMLLGLGAVGLLGYLRRRSKG